MRMDWKEEMNKYNHNVVRNAVSLVRKRFANEADYNGVSNLKEIIIGDDIEPYKGNAPTGYFEICLYRNKTSTVRVINIETEKRYPNIENAILNSIPDFAELENDWEDENSKYDMWNENGFRDEQDYIHWKYGD